MSKEIEIWQDEKSIQSIKDIFGKGLSNEEFNTLLGIGRATNCNPFLREIYAVKYGSSPAQIFIGRDGYRKSAQSYSDYDYHQVDAVYSGDKFEVVNGVIAHSYNMVDRGILVGAYCTVKRRSSTKEIFVFVNLREYNTGKSVWASKPATMIKKVAEAQGLRMAFQALFSGTYDESEKWEDKKVEIKSVQANTDEINTSKENERVLKHIAEAKTVEQLEECSSVITDETQSEYLAKFDELQGAKNE